MKAFRKTILFPFVWFFFVVGIATAAGNYNDRTINNPFAIPTFHCISVYWSTRGGSADKDVLVNYRPKGTSEWLQALTMRYNPISTTTEDKA
ncbi:MAG: hypothetical protein ACYST5_14465, partial [Planctomycetota bacterium]